MRVEVIIWVKPVQYLSTLITNHSNMGREEVAFNLMQQCISNKISVHYGRSPKDRRTACHL